MLDAAETYTTHDAPLEAGTKKLYTKISKQKRGRRFYQKMWRLTVCAFVVIAFAAADERVTRRPEAAPTPAAVATAQFQLQFLEQIIAQVDASTAEALNQLLRAWQADPQYAQFHPELLRVESSRPRLEQKMLFIKQSLDMKSQDRQTDTSEQDYQTLRNVNFLKRLRQQLHEAHEQSVLEQRQRRLHAVCQQLARHAAATTTPRPAVAEVEAAPTPYPRTKLMPLLGEEENVSRMLTALQPDPTAVKLDLNAFGRAVYDRVNHTSGAIIDEFLHTIRQLLHEVRVEQSEEAPPEAKLQKFIGEIDAILAISDFYEKRQRLYAYLQSSLASDYEQLKREQEDLADIFMKLKHRGFNVFVAFLFSNLEFLERLHAEWQQLLPPEGRAAADDEDTAALVDIARLYVAFKEDTDNNERYDAYMHRVKQLHQRNLAANNTAEYMPILELLHNASLNVGSVTMNIIKSKCEEL